MGEEIEERAAGGRVEKLRELEMVYW